MIGATRRVQYVDGIGRKFEVILPDGDDDPAHGIIVGPPFIDEVLRAVIESDLESLLVRLHNELYARRVLTYEDAKRHIPEVVSAIKSALRVDAAVVMEAYRGGVETDSPNGLH